MLLYWTLLSNTGTHNHFNFMTFQSLGHTSCHKYAKEIRCSVMKKDLIHGRSCSGGQGTVHCTKRGVFAGKWVNGDLLPPPPH